MEQYSTDNVELPPWADYGYATEITCDHNSLVIVDRHNSRLKVMEYDGNDIGNLLRQIKGIAVENHLGKIIFYAKEKLIKPLTEQQFLLEGTIPHFFSGKDCYCLSYFMDQKRSISSYINEEDKLIKTITAIELRGLVGKLPKGLYLKNTSSQDARDLVELYGEVFSSYPSALLDIDYVKSVINDRVFFVAVYDGKKIISAASAEMDKKNRNAEITDCATLPEYRGRGLLTVIISALEKEMGNKAVAVLYSLARANSFGMNAVLHKLNYSYTGRMINNCHINGRYENMNIWVKPIRKI